MVTLGLQGVLADPFLGTWPAILAYFWPKWGFWPISAKIGQILADLTDLLRARANARIS